LFYQLFHILGFIPGNLNIYNIAFVHKSASQVFNDGSQINNERLEYLGDAILDAIIADYLYAKFPKKDEGFLTQLRSKIVNRDMLNQLAQETGVSELVVMLTKNCKHKYIYGDAFEAFIGAIYLDKGYEKTKKFVIRSIIRNHLNLHELIEKETDFKSRIIEWGQKNKKDICFTCTEELSSLNKLPLFIARIKNLDEVLGVGTGPTKKEAEQNAAEQAISKIGIQINI
jgi:ribonuclease-3